jgi:hypothetical protein
MLKPIQHIENKTVSINFLNKLDLPKKFISKNSGKKTSPNYNEMVIEFRSKFKKK